MLEATVFLTKKMPLLTPEDWDCFLRQYPDAHFLQTSAWAELKAIFGWESARVADGENGAQVLFRRLPMGVSLAYIPKGPLGAIVGWEGFWPEVDELCRQRRAVFVKVEPDLEQGEADSFWAGAPPPGFRLSPQAIQPLRTLTIDLRPDEEAILARMKQKTRYNIHLAARKGVVVHPSSDIDTFYKLINITGERSEFGVHSLGYYRRAYEIFHPRGQCELLQAEYQGEPLAALMVFTNGQRAWYLYGASSEQERNRMPTYLLQWEAMRWARQRGCALYDLWGVPDCEEAELEEQFTGRNDGLWGVYRFKRGFGGELRRAAGPWDRVYNPLLYALYRWWLSR
ncbi:MAG: peptidoglycan bridge formation glycyltransferase FemA/FemB family protein [Chloroflexi bacterium]|nr:peptidoglycan bridge formation glycyltransferase FemA/FemB family protein [Chloroflexota bacterium]